MKTLLMSLLLVCAPIAAFGMGDEYRDEYDTPAAVQDQRSLRIFHDPVPELKWAAMNRQFGVDEDGLIRSLKTGDIVRFEFFQRDGESIIIGIAK